MKTIAEQISEMFMNNENCFCDGAGHLIFNICQDQMLLCIRDKLFTNRLKFIFDDGSSIIFHEGIWGLGFVGCFCLKNNGHDSSCSDYIIEKIDEIL